MKQVFFQSALYVLQSRAPDDKATQPAGKGPCLIPHATIPDLYRRLKPLYLSTCCSYQPSAAPLPAPIVIPVHVSSGNGERWPQGQPGLVTRWHFIQGACSAVPTLIHTFMAGAGIIILSSQFIRFYQLFNIQMLLKKQELHLRMHWDASNRYGRQRTEEKKKKKKHNHFKMSLQTVISVSFFQCQNCAFAFPTAVSIHGDIEMNYVLIMQGATASPEYSPAIFGSTKIVHFCCDFSKCTYLAWGY